MTPQDPYEEAMEQMGQAACRKVVRMYESASKQVGMLKLHREAREGQGPHLDSLEAAALAVFPDMPWRFEWHNDRRGNLEGVEFFVMSEPRRSMVIPAAFLEKNGEAELTEALRDADTKFWAARS